MSTKKNVLSFLIGPPKEACHILSLTKGRGVDGNVLLVEIVVGVHVAAVPAPAGVPVKRVRAAVAHVVHIGSRHGVFAGVAIADDGRFIDVVLSEQNIRRAGVVKAQERIIFRHAVVGEIISNCGHAVAGEIAHIRPVLFMTEPGAVCAM